MVDAIGIYCGDLDRCFLVPIDVIAGQWAMQLRLAPARNGQRAALHFADEYDLGAVAQLAERVDGIDEAEGSNPSSSTHQDTSSAPASEEVGAVLAVVAVLGVFGPIQGPRDRCR